jgi:uncharacterized protein YjbI with pentapeptide repeats
MNIEIKYRFDSAKVLWAGEAESMKDAVLKALASGADLRDANLNGADLNGAYLNGADLNGADLNGAYLGDANLNGADLGGAYLNGADLNGADLNGAYLNGADLGDADLGGADLNGADLGGADLGGAYLNGADLNGANLNGAYLNGADLGDANLNGAYLNGAYLNGANLNGANLNGAYLGGAQMPDGFDRAAHKDPETPYARRVPEGTTPADTCPQRTPEERAAHRKAARLERAVRYRERHPEVPIVEHLDAKILADIEAGRLFLDMRAWHGSDPEGFERTDKTPCGTTHCRAGSAVHEAGEAGYALERKLGSAAAAGRAIYIASTGRSPYFYGSNERALADIKRCAAEDT